MSPALTGTANVTDRQMYRHWRMTAIYQLVYESNTIRMAKELCFGDRFILEGNTNIPTHFVYCMGYTLLTATVTVFSALIKKTKQKLENVFSFVWLFWLNK